MDAITLTLSVDRQTIPIQVSGIPMIDELHTGAMVQLAEMTWQDGTPREPRFSLFILDLQAIVSTLTEIMEGKQDPNITINHNYSLALWANGIRKDIVLGDELDKLNPDLADELGMFARTIDTCSDGRPNRVEQF